MKKLTLFILLIVLFSCAKKSGNIETNSGERITSFKELKANFHNPPVAYRTAPFWVWNNDVSKEDIDRTLSEYKDKGYGGVFLHPRYGLITEYLSDKWWNLVSYSLQKAKELDLKLWIYDENSFPSGFGGGHVPAQMPESTSEGVALKPHFMDVLQIPEELERVKHIFKKEGKNWIEIAKGVNSELGKKGEYCVLDLNDYETSKWFAGYSYVDLLKPGVTEKFIGVTMPGYEKTLGAEFGKQVPGIFTDEPNINTRSAGPIRYTPDLYEQFEKQWGYQLQPHLMSLITETGDYRKIRHNYQSTLLRLFIERWSKPWYNYTEEKKLLWTGHYWEHGWPNPKEGPDNMAMYAWHQQPAIDLLFNSEKLRPDQFGNIRNVKELSSVANQFDRHRALSETYGAAGWELTFDDMKRLGDWEYVLGVNFMNQHLAYMSLAGDRKHDFPQGFGTFSPYWGLMRYQTDYFARLSLALSSGFQRNHILIIEPTTTAWMYYNPTEKNEKMMEVKTKFESLLKQLEHYQVEYDLGSENIIKDQGRIHDGKFGINKAEYDWVILPPGLENLDESTFNLLKEFTENGGKVWQINAPLQYLNGSKKSFDEIQKNENWKVLKDVENTVFADLATNENIHFENADSIGGRVFHQRREFDDGQLLFLTNFDKNETAEVKVDMPGKSVIHLNPADGIIGPYHFESKNKRVWFPAVLPPSGSCLLFVSNKRGKSKVPEKPRTRMLYPSGELTAERVTPNILNLDYVELTMGKFKNEPMYYYAAANEIWKQHGYPDNPWASSSQYKTELADADTFPEGTGFAVSYPFVVDENFKTQKMQLVVERPWLYQISVNGKSVTQKLEKFWLDPDFHRFEIGNLIQKGNNKITLETSKFSMYCELEPVYLLGNFSLVSQASGWKLINEEKLGLGSWKKQGMPFFGQTVSYSKQIRTTLAEDFIIKVPEWKGTVAEILIDDKHQGVIYSKPYRLKLGIPYGQHDVTVRITGSLKNTLGPHHNFTTPGFVTPASFKTAPKIQPAGEKYDLLDYGLMKDFEIYKLSEEI